MECAETQARARPCHCAVWDFCFLHGWTWCPTTDLLLLLYPFHRPAPDNLDFSLLLWNQLLQLSPARGEFNSIYFSIPDSFPVTYCLSIACRMLHMTGIHFFLSWKLEVSPWKVQQHCRSGNWEWKGRIGKKRKLPILILVLSIDFKLYSPTVLIKSFQHSYKEIMVWWLC